MNDEHQLDSDPDISDIELEALEHELPVLALVRRFAETAARTSWFRTLGEPLDEETLAAARNYLDALGFPDAEIAQISDWTEAADAAASLDWDSEAWEVEEQLRAGLTSEALALLSEEALKVSLTTVALAVQDEARAAAEESAAIYDEADENLVNAAAGAALQAAHMAALVIASGTEEDHPLALKYRLFELGRWPIGIAGRSLNLF